MEEGKKNALINEQLEDVEGVKAPEIFDYSKDKVVTRIYEFYFF